MKKINIIQSLQTWMDSPNGQVFLNYAYSWGASVVILGTLFKLTHLPGANLMLYIGMGTEVVVFFLAGFERTFGSGGGKLKANKNTEEESTVTPQIVGGGIVGGTTIGKGNAEATEGASVSGGPVISGGVIGGGVIGGGTVVGGELPEGGTIVGGGGVIGGGIIGSGGSTVILGGSHSASASNEGQSEQAEGENILQTPSEKLEVAAMQQGVTPASLIEIIRLANEELLQQAKATFSPEMEEASKTYVEKLQLLTDTLDKVEQQCARLTTDSEEMASLNRTLTGINTVYEVQLKSVSSQVGTMDQINEQTRKMAKQIEELNGVYARMIKALTVNMKNAAGVVNESES